MRAIQKAGLPKTIPVTTIDKAVHKVLEISESGEKVPVLHRPKALLLLVLVLVGLVGFGLWASGVVHMQASEGEIAFQTEPDDPTFAFSFGKGDAITLEDRKAKRTYNVKAVRKGKDDYELEVTDAEAQLVFKTQTFMVKRGGKVALKAWFERKAYFDPDRHAAIYVMSVGGVVRIDNEDRDLKELAELPKDSFHLTSVDLAGKNVSNADFTAFKGCKNLTRLKLPGTRVSNDGLAYFKDCKGLTFLDLYGATKVGDEGLAYFKDCKGLTELGLGNTQVTNAGLAHFQGCKHLTALNLDNNKQVGDSGVAHFEGCKKLQFLGVAGTKVSNAGLVLVKNWKGLIYLNLGAASDVSDLSPLKGMKLSALYFPRTKVADLTPLKGMPLKIIECDFKTERDAVILRSIKTLVTINNKPAKEFWKEVDRQHD